MWIHLAWVEYQRKRFARHDAHRYAIPGTDRCSDADRKADAAPAASGQASEAKLLQERLALAQLRLHWELLKFAIKARKAGFNPTQPRDDRGRWADGFRIVAAGMPGIPKQRPPNSGDRTAIYKRVAAWVAENSPVIFEGIAKTSWLYPALPAIWSYRDAPKGLQELQHDLSPKAGYDVHHIVERSSAAEAGYPAKRIDGADNLVRIPRIRHWEINAWYQTRNPDYSDVSPRDYLRGKDWDERRRVGVEALIRFKVLKQ